MICVWLKANFHLVGDILVSRSAFSRAWASIFLSPAESAVYVAHLGLGLWLLEEGAVGASDVHLSASLNSHTHWSRLLSPCNRSIVETRPKQTVRILNLIELSKFD